MHIPFLRKTDAIALLEQVRYDEENFGEMLAEIGSSYFHGGMRNYDAINAARGDLAEREEDFRASEEGELYFAKLDAARLYEDVEAAALTDWDIPEFVNGEVSWAHSPYFRPYIASDDIPF